MYIWYDLLKLKAWQLESLLTKIEWKEIEIMSKAAANSVNQPEEIGKKTLFNFNERKT